MIRKLKNIQWEEWELLATNNEYFPVDYEYDIPGIYLLGITDMSIYEIKKYGIDDEDVKIVYIGESGCIMDRLNSYGETGSHLYDIIDYHLNEGFKLSYSIYETISKENAQELEYQFLMEYDFDWNIKNN